MSIKNSKTTLLVAIIFCLGLYSSFSALGATNPDPAGEDFIRSLRDQVLSTLTPKELSEADRKSNFEKILDRYFDINRMARMSLGRYWRKAGKDERNEFILQFKAMVVNTYAERFKSYSGERLTVSGSAKRGRMILVNSEFKKKGEKPIRIDWRIFGIKDKYKLFDVIIEGVSLVQTNRSQFSSVVRRNDGSISALLKLLREKNSN